MGVPERLVEVWAAGGDGRGKAGSGWIVGHSGVLSCRHVLDRYLASADASGSGAGGGQAKVQVRVAGASSVSAWVDCTVSWRHPVRDLVLLHIKPQPGQSWDFPPGRASRLAGTGEQPSECTAAGFPDAEVRSAGVRDSEQVTGRLLPGGAARDPEGLVPFDVDSSVPDSAALWEGFSGSAVVDRRTRLVGLVAKVHPDRQQRRLLVVPVEEAAKDPAFAAAAAAVGLDPVVEDFQAAAWRQSVEPRALAVSGVPVKVAEVTDLRVFGVHGSSSGAGSAYAGYVRRDKDAELDAALAQATSGGQRVVLVAGDSAAGKSRSAAEALGRDRVLRGWWLVVPLADGGLSRLADADLGWHETVIWLDDLDKYLARLDLGTLRRILGEDPAVVVVATMRTSQLQARQSQLADPAWEFLTDDSVVTRVDLDASLSEDELQAASETVSDKVLLEALREGVGLGEWLVAGPQLMKKLHDERGLNRIFADTVISWYRTGLDQPLAAEDARRLWVDGLPVALRDRLLGRGPDEQSQLFQQASAWACMPVFSRALYEQALISKVAGGYVAHDYVVDQIVRDARHLAVPDPVWEQALRFATSSPESDQRPRLIWAVGIAAYQERALAHSLTAMQTLTDSGDINAPLNTGVILGELGQPEDGIAAYDQVVERFGEATGPALREQVAKALVNKGVTLGQLGRSEEAAGAYDQVVERFGEATGPALREQVAMALVNKGVRLGVLGRSEEAAGAYDQVVERFGEATEPALREQVARALYNKGFRLVSRS